MRYKLLGKSGLRVSELCLGAMTFGRDWELGADREESRKVFDAFANAGGNFIDTAVNYAKGTSETYLGEFLKGEREHFVIATKYTGTDTAQTDPNQGGNSRKNMMQSVERSLKRLQTETIDLFYLHVWDHMTPVEEVMRALDDLVRSGKVQYVGISDTPAWIVAEANTLAELRGWSRFVAFQLPYSLLNREIERAEIPAAQHWDIAVLAWAILGDGLLTGKYATTSGEARRLNNPTITGEQQHIIDTVQSVAEAVGRSPAQVAINWVRQQQARALMIPIVGARTYIQLCDNLAALDWELAAEQLQALNDASAIRYGVPRDMIEDGARPHVFGTTFDLIDNHRGNPVR